jgi:O-antigen biosynthesis protein WbqV
MRCWLAALEEGLRRDDRTTIYQILRDAVPDFRGEAA